MVIRSQVETRLQQTGEVFGKERTSPFTYNRLFSSVAQSSGLKRGAMSEGRKEYTLLWFIEKYSYLNDGGCWSPKFHTDGLKGTDWYLGFGIPYQSGYVSLQLRRWADDGPQDFPLTFQFSLLAADGSAHHSAEFKFTFVKPGAELQPASRYDDLRFMSTDELHVRRAEYLPNDTLTVCCKMWTGEGDVIKAGRISARSRPMTEKLSFSHVIEKFSDLEPNVKKQIHEIQSHLDKIYVFSFSLYLIDDTFGEEKIMIENVSAKPLDMPHKFEFFSKGGNHLMYCGKTAVARKHPELLTLSLTRQDILNNKWTRLADDKLTLVCVCTFSNGLRSHEIEEIEKKVSDSKSIDKASQIMLNEHPGVSEDMKALYNEQCLTDVQLKTKTKTFAAHKLVLCARSPEFKAMLTNGIKKKITDSIQVDDLEDDIVHQLLLFLYSDCLEPLQWRSATQLYDAADKYAVRKLQAMCSKFLVENLTTSNAIELLLLADVHNDSNLKDIVEDFILENHEQVFGSSEWEKLMETNPQLVMKTMHLMYKKKSKVSSMKDSRMTVNIQG